MNQGTKTFARRLIAVFLFILLIFTLLCGCERMERRKELESMGFTEDEAREIEEREYEEMHKGMDEDDPDYERAIEAWIEQGLSREDAESKVKEGILPDDFEPSWVSSELAPDEDSDEELEFKGVPTEPFLDPKLVPKSESESETEPEPEPEPEETDAAMDPFLGKWYLLNDKNERVKNAFYLIERKSDGCFTLTWGNDKDGCLEPEVCTIIERRSTEVLLDYSSNQGPILLSLIDDNHMYMSGINVFNEKKEILMTVSWNTERGE